MKHIHIQQQPRSNTRLQYFRNTASVLLLAAMISACGGGGGGGDGGSNPQPNPSTTVSGAITAPGGAIAFNAPGLMQQMLAGFFGRAAYGAISGVVSVGAGVPVELIQIDASGNQIGTALATTTTDASGNYTFTIANFTPGPQYIVRATGSSEIMDARVTGNTVNIDPVSDAASDIITANVSNLSSLTTTEVDEIKKLVDSFQQDVSPLGLTANALSNALVNVVNNDISANNMIAAASANSQICGKVQDNAGASLQGIRIVVRDFGDWVTRNKTQTDSNGDFCVNVPAGDYIVGAINISSTSQAASEWYNNAGDANTQFQADQVTVTTGSTQTTNFVLENGATVTGNVTAGTGGSLASGSPLENVRVIVRTFKGFFPVATTSVKADGSYRINVKPGDYIITARNRTLVLDYGSEMYDGGSGTSNRNLASKVTLAAGNTGNIDFVLDGGLQLSGEVLDAPAPGGNPVSGVRVRVSITGGGPSYRVRTKLDGKYRLWIQPGFYDISSHGKPPLSKDITTLDQVCIFESPVGTITGNVVDGNGQAVSQAKLFLRDTNGNLVNQEISNSDGSFTLYSDSSANHLLEIRIDHDRTVGSMIYNNGKTQLLTGDLISTVINTNVDLGNVTLPTTGVASGAGILSGTVFQNDGVTPAANVRVQVRDGGLTSNERFLQTRTRSDGSYTLTLPSVSYERIRAGGTTGTNANNVVVNDGTTTTVNFVMP